MPRVGHGRDESTGRLTFFQVLRDNVGGVDGLESPSALGISADGATVYASSAPAAAKTAVASHAVNNRPRYGRV